MALKQTGLAVGPAVLSGFLADVAAVAAGSVEYRYRDGRPIRLPGPGGVQRAVSVSPGARRYARIVLGEPADARTAPVVYGFIDLTNGCVLMDAGWRGPDPTPRGNLLDPRLDPSLGRAALARSGVRRLDDPALDRDMLARLRERFLDESGEAPAKPPAGSAAASLGGRVAPTALGEFVHSSLDPRDDRQCTWCRHDGEENAHTHPLAPSSDGRCGHRYPWGESCEEGRAEHGLARVSEVSGNELVCWCAHSLHFRDCPDGDCHLEDGDGRCARRFVAEGRRVD